MNGLYEAFCIICIFPVIVSMGAGGRITGKRSAAVCKFLGDISYPVYITHYPLVYIYIGMGVQPSGDTCRRPSLHAAHVRRGVRACLCLPEVL